MASREKHAERRNKRLIWAILERTVFFLVILLVVECGADLMVAHYRTKSYEVSNSGGTESLQTSAEKDADETEISAETESESEAEPETQEYIQTGDVTFLAGYTAKETEDTAEVDLESVVSTNAILIDESTNTILAQKDAYARISPASMTKILTILTAAELIEDWDAEVEITAEVMDYAYVNDCSIAGFEVGETVTVADLFYGTILPSGADAAVALAVYAAGSHEAFVEKMNEKLEELGLSKTTHFTNCVGLYDENHYSTVYDMAMILKAAVENDYCREVLTAHTYTTSVTDAHPEGITISNWFLRRIEDKDTGGEVICAKTGFVNESGNCAASYQVSDDGVPYICVTVGSSSNWRCIYDHVDIYNAYMN